MTSFHELNWCRSCQKNNLEEFYRYIREYDRNLVPTLKAKGYTLKSQAERTVIFTFGEATFKRNRWYRKGKCYIPVDDMLHLKKYERYSSELLYRIADLATRLPYRQVVEVVDQCYRVTITKDTVLKARKWATDLFKEQTDYRFFEDDVPMKKIRADVIYIEGDGVVLKTRESDKEQQRMELAHFVIHTGSYQKEKNRLCLRNKKEFVAHSNYQARQMMMDYLYNYYEITEDTLLITNSDGGKGYTPYIFKEIAQGCKIKKHEHFWDKYHIFQEIKQVTRPYKLEIRDILYQAILRHDKKLLRSGFDTLESLVIEEEEQQKILNYRRKFFKNFQYTKPAEMRGISQQGIGVMESQHRKITYRMKHRGAYWSRDGAVTLAKLILANTEEKRDLFFGNWRERYQRYQELDIVGKKSRVMKKEYSLPRLSLRRIKGRF